MTSPGFKIQCWLYIRFIWNQFTSASNLSHSGIPPDSSRRQRIPHSEFQILTSINSLPCVHLHMTYFSCHHDSARFLFPTPIPIPGNKNKLPLPLRTHADAASLTVTRLKHAHNPPFHAYTLPSGESASTRTNAFIFIHQTTK